MKFLFLIFVLISVIPENSRCHRNWYKKVAEEFKICKKTFLQSNIWKQIEANQLSQSTRQCVCETLRPTIMFLCDNWNGHRYQWRHRRHHHKLPRFCKKVLKKVCSESIPEQPTTESASTTTPAPPPPPPQTTPTTSAPTTTTPPPTTTTTPTTTTMPPTVPTTQTPLETTTCVQGVQCPDAATLPGAPQSSCSCDNECSSVYHSCCTTANNALRCYYVGLKP